MRFEVWQIRGSVRSMEFVDLRKIVDSGGLCRMEKEVKAVTASCFFSESNLRLNSPPSNKYTFKSEKSTSRSWDQQLPSPHSHMHI